MHKNDEKFMARALLLAKKGRGICSPDPLVGAVVVKNNKIIGEGYHGQFASAHAENWALRKAKEKAKGSTLYVTLEPCCHFGNNSPCVDYIISAGVKRVAASMQDPNHLVNGKGFKTLRKAGIKVDVGILEKESRKMNEVFIKHITTGLPFVTVKVAMSLDGKISLANGESRWISSHESRKLAHELRNDTDAVMVGINTILIDDPSLTVRYAYNKIKNPARIVLDTRLKIPFSARVLNINEAPTIIVTDKKSSKAKIKRLLKKGAEVIRVDAVNNKLNLAQLMKILGEKNIASVLIEGGGNAIAGAIEAGIVDKVIFVIAPKMIGGKNSLTPVEGDGIPSLDKAIKVKDINVYHSGEDVVVEGYL